MSASSLRDLLARLPPDATLPAAWISDQLQESEIQPPSEVGQGEPLEVTWRERLWSAPAETRMGVPELCEGLGRSKSWVYHRTGERARDRIPHRRLDGELVFTAGEVRAWIRGREKVITAGPMESPPSERKIHVVQGGRG